MAKDVKERAGKKKGETILTLGDDAYFKLTEGGQNRAKALGYSGFIYTPQTQANIDRAHKMIEEGKGVGLVGAGMLINYLALKVAGEEAKAKVLNRKGEVA